MQARQGAAIKKMTPVRLLAVDLDGTLLDSKWNLSEANRTALRQAYDRGVHVAFVTGRRYQITKPITSTLEFPHFVITTAGAVTRTSSGGQLFSHTMDPRVVRELLRHIAHFRPWTFVISDVEGREDVLCESPGANPHVAGYVERNEDFLTRSVDLAAAVTNTIIEVLLVGHVAEMSEASVLIDSFPMCHRLKVLRTEYIHRDMCMLDVVDAATDKGLAVRQLAESLAIPREAVMAIGDNQSDLDMLAYAGWPVVMGNASQELRSAGWPVTSSNDENGVAQAIEKFILEFPSQTPLR